MLKCISEVPLDIPGVGRIQPGQVINDPNLERGLKGNPLFAPVRETVSVPLKDKIELTPEPEIPKIKKGKY